MSWNNIIPFGVVTLPSEAAQQLAAHLKELSFNFLTIRYIGEEEERVVINTDLLAKTIQEYWDSMV